MNKRFKLYIASLGVLLSTVFVVNGLSGGAFAAIDNTPDCNDGVAVVNCGIFDKNKIMSRTSTGDIPRIYNAMGISRADLRGDYQNGIVWRDGRVTVNGKVVATNAKTAGRNYGGTPISGTNAGIYPTSKFVDEGQTAFVKMENGKFKFAVVKACGNPVTGTPKEPPKEPKPKYSCDELNKTKISRTEYRFNGSASAENGARIVGYRFDFGDGTRERSDVPRIRHEYTKPGDYRVTMTALVRVNGKLQEADGNKCRVNITVQPPEEIDEPEVNVEKKVIDNSGELVENATFNVDQTFQYQLVVRNPGNVTLKNVRVSDDAPNGVTFLDASAGSITDNKWRYTIPSLEPGKSQSITITAKVPVYLAGSIENTVCVDAPAVDGNPDDCDDATVQVPDNRQVIVCDPETGETRTVPVADESKYEPVNSELCQKKGEDTPTKIADTGPAAIAAGLFGSGSLGYGAYAYASSRRSLIDKLMGR